MGQGGVEMEVEDCTNCDAMRVQCVRFNGAGANSLDNTNGWACVCARCLFKAIAALTPAKVCTCAEIQRDDPRRHFKGCALREPLPEADQKAIDAASPSPRDGLRPGEALCAAVLRDRRSPLFGALSGGSFFDWLESEAALSGWAALEEALDAGSRAVMRKALEEKNPGISLCILRDHLETVDRVRK